MSEFEIERKYLLLPCSPSIFLNSIGIEYRKERIEQYYLPNTNKQNIRYRRKGKTYYKTVKVGEGMVRKEHEYVVEKNEYNAFINEHTGSMITKDRYTFRYQSVVYELDQFKGSLKGLCYLEIEFDGKLNAEQFILPELFSPLLVTEVTDDIHFSNASLSLSDTVPLPKFEDSMQTSNDAVEVIEPFMSSSEAICMISHRLMMDAKGHLTALGDEEYDTEVLHQFRITLRRLRTVLKEFSDYFEPNWLDEHKKNLSKIMKWTNAKRDADVALETMGDYRKLTPKKMQKGLNPLEDMLSVRKKNLRELIIELPQNKLLLSEILAFEQLDKQDSCFQSKATTPVVIAAISILDKRLKKIIDSGKKIDAEFSDEAYHKLRIQFKKLRYFIELMEPIIDAKKYKKALKQLKNIQDLLGEYNDLCVQSADLKKFSKDTKLQKKRTKKALNELKKTMKELKTRNREHFHKKFQKFRRHKQLFNGLLFN